MKEKDYQVIQGDNRINRLKKFLPDVFKAMWVGEGKRKKEPVDEKAEARFNDVVNKIHEREDNYKAGLKADGSMSFIRRERSDRSQQKQHTLSQDRAD